jgi:carbamoyltransferase
VNILGLSAFYHDSAACLVRDGRILAAAQEERFTRRKHDARYPAHAVAYCLQAGGLAAPDLDYVAFYEKPFLKFDRLLHTYLACAPRGLRTFLKAIPVWIKDRLWLKETLRRALPGFRGRFIFPEHHESHAASAFFPSPYRAAAFLTVDGVGEWTTTSYGVGRDNRVELHADLRFPHSLGLLYSAFTDYCGFKVNSGEYKLMGLAPYGAPRFKSLILRELLDLKPDGSLRLNLEYFDYVVGLKMINARFERLLGQPARAPESPLTQHIMDVARSIQEVTEEILLSQARHVRRETGLTRLCLAGGVALNCSANGRLLRERVFDEIWVQPAAGDAGGALGAALFTWHQYLGNTREPDGVRDFQQGSLLGPDYSRETMREFLQRQGAPFVELTENDLPARIADLIADGNVVGWFQGRMEFGPRALGARSILGDPRSPTMQETMNLKIKFRESFRPFAPTVLAERASEWFELDRPSPYMLFVAPVQRERRRALTAEEASRAGLERLRTVRSEIPAVTHVDDSARVQTLSESDQPLLYWTLQRFADKTGCPLVINTSFNVRGEPIVCTPEDAYRCFLHTNMDYLLLGPFLLEKQAQQPLDKPADGLREFELD